MRSLLEDTHFVSIRKNTMQLSKIVRFPRCHRSDFMSNLCRFLVLVEMTGIEPVTCGLQSHRSPN
jgi:hypothetical protein